MATHYIGADVHTNNTQLAVEYRRKIVQRYSVPTSIPAISAVLGSLQGKKFLAMEEGPMGGWLYRNLSQEVDRFIVCEPRRNKLISSEGDRDDKIDSGKLAVLLRGNFVKAVHHTSDPHRAHLKHWIKLYHDRIRAGVRDINKIRACCRMHGVRIPRKVVRSQLHRHQWLSGLDNTVLKAQLKMFWIGYDATKEQVALAKKQFSSYARKYPVIKSWCELPGVGLIRATTIFAYLDAPLAVQEQSQAAQVLWRWTGQGIQWKGQKGPAQAAQIETAVACQRTVEGCGHGGGHQCNRGDR